MSSYLINGQESKRNAIDWNPLAVVRTFLHHKDLIKQLVIREIIGRYRGSYLGVLWSFITPLLMMFIYTFVFSVVFKARWGGSGDKIEFALILFAGISTFNLFAEVVTKSPSLIVENANYVKKVVFPLEVFPIVLVMASLVHTFISYSILLLSIWLFQGGIHWTMLYAPLVILPLILFSIGLSWLLTSLGVYLRDIGHIIGLAVQALMFLSPIFYPVSAVPKSLQALFILNPIGYVVEDIRRVLIWGQAPDFRWLFIGVLVGVIVAQLGYVWFQKTRGGFADVL